MGHFFFFEETYSDNYIIKPKNVSTEQMEWHPIVVELYEYDDDYGFSTVNIQLLIYKVIHQARLSLFLFNTANI